MVNIRAGKAFDDERNRGGDIQVKMPLLPLRGVLVFPFMVVPLEVGRQRSLKALESAMLGDRRLVFVAQQDTRLDEPTADDLYAVGVVGEIKQLLKMPTGGSKVVVEGLTRARIHQIETDGEFYTAEVEEVPESVEDISDEVEALMRAVVDLFEVYIKNSKKIPGEASVSMNIDDPGRLADTITNSLELRTAEKQEVLETFEVDDRLNRVSDLLSRQMELLELEKRISGRVRKQMERTQKEYYLREQLKAIQRELGERDEQQTEVEDFQQRLEALEDLSQEVREKIEREIDRLGKMQGCRQKPLWCAITLTGS